MGAEKSRKRNLAVYGAFALIGGLLFFRYLFSTVLPFLAGFLAASLLHRPSRKLSRALRIPYRAAAVGLTVFSVSVLLGLFGILIWQTLSELGSFAKESLNGENTLLENLSDIVRRLGNAVSELPFLSERTALELKENVMQTVSEMIRNGFVSAASRFPALASKLVSAIPQIFIFCVITVLSAVYFCMDYEKLSRFLQTRVSTERWEAAVSAGKTFKRTALQFLKSYLVLFLITFAGLFLGFTLLRENYAFLFALITAAVDGLPIFGMGIVMLPLAVFRFMTGEVGYGVGLCILYLALTVLRQVLEPKILGAGLGVHPLLMLFAMYLGLKWLGVGGMLIAPFLTVAVKNLTEVRKNQEQKENFV
ncbi:MAG: sporulation integral membrane protein YtvI [Clostridia bacterium]|nr:sporulation integral membrane protein YtvI [Clostridia bacterium]